MLSIDEIKRRKKTFGKMVQRCADYLQTGAYHVTKTYGKFALKKGRIDFRNPRDYYYWLLFGSYRIHNTSGKAACTTALTSPFDNFKMFDYEGRRTYTIYSDVLWDRVLLFYNRMAPYLPSTLLSMDEKAHVSREMLVNTVPIKDYNACFQAFSDSYRRYVEHAKVEGAICLQDVRAVFAGAGLCPEVRSYITRIERELEDDPTRYPTIVCHNDAQINNILTEDNQTFRLIDFELCGANVFFFDVMGMIANSAVFFSDMKLVDQYRIGKYDGVFDELFGIYHLQYDPKKRRHYLFLFLYIRLSMVYAIQPEHLQLYTRRINAFMEKISNLEL